MYKLFGKVTSLNTYLKLFEMFVGKEATEVSTELEINYRTRRQKIKLATDTRQKFEIGKRVDGAYRKRYEQRTVQVDRSDGTSG